MRALLMSSTYLLYWSAWDTVYILAVPLGIVLHKFGAISAMDGLSTIDLPIQSTIFLIDTNKPIEHRPWIFPTYYKLW